MLNRIEKNNNFSLDKGKIIQFIKEFKVIIGGLLLIGGTKIYTPEINNTFKETKYQTYEVLNKEFGLKLETSDLEKVHNVFISVSEKLNTSDVENPDFQLKIWEEIRKIEEVTGIKLLHSLILGYLYWYAYMATIRRVRDQYMPIDVKSFLTFSLTSGGMVFVNGLVPGSMVYAESFLLAGWAVVLHLKNTIGDKAYLSDEVLSLLDKIKELENSLIEKEEVLGTEISRLESELELAQKGNEPLEKVGFNEEFETFIKDTIDSCHGDIIRLKEIFDLCPIPVSAYDGKKPLFNNKALEKISGFTFEDVLAYYEKHGEVMTLYYKNTPEHKDLDQTLMYLSMLGNEKKEGYSGVPFSMTTRTNERVTLNWTTRPYSEKYNFRFGIPIDRKIAELEQLLRIDILTGILNKVAFNQDFLNLSLDNRNNHKKYTIVSIDLDDFKTINDTYGHPFGDTILKNFANHVKGKLRDEDKFYRMGGDEFAIIMETDNMDIIYKKLNQIRESFYKITFTYNNNEINVGSSHGLKYININDYNPGNIDTSSNINIINILIEEGFAQDIDSLLKENIKSEVFDIIKSKYASKIKEFIIAANNHFFIEENKTEDYITNFIETEINKGSKYLFKYAEFTNIYMEIFPQYISNLKYSNIGDIVELMIELQHATIKRNSYLLLSEIDEYMYRVKYYRLIKDKLIKDGRMEKSEQKPKNGIAEPIFDENGEFTGVKVINSYGEFILKKDELEEIKILKKKYTDEGKDLRSI